MPAPAAAADFDILGIGNAIVDVLAPVEESFLSKHDMRKGSMALIDAESAERLYRAMPAGQESSGGSAANTCAVASLLGAKVAYIGQVPTISWAPCSATTSARAGCISRRRRWWAARRPRAASSWCRATRNGR